MKSFRFVLSLALLATLVASQCFAAGILAPGDAILGGRSDGTNFAVGVTGTAAGVNNWPGAETPDKAIDGVGQKYLNFAETNTGFIVTPASGSSVAGSIQLWTANDAVERDPTGFQLWGTNVAISGPGPFAMSDFTQIAAGSLTLPASRNAGGTSALLDANSQTVAFANSTGYSSYMVLFPDVKTPASANSMQIAEVQLYAVPEPSTAVLGFSLAILVAPLAGRMRRRRS